MGRTRRSPHGRSGLARGVLLVVLVGAVSMLGAMRASAHASLVSADPPPGATVPQAPGAVVMHFSEGVDRARSAVTVTGPGGHDATIGPTDAVPNDRRALRRPLGLERPGRYDVRWTSVSSDDGHIESGGYSFGIGTPASPTRHTSGGAVSSEGLIGLLSQLALVLGLTMWVGAVLLGRPAVRAGVVPATLGYVRQASPALVLVAVVVRATAAAAKAPALGRVLPTILAGRAGELGTLLVGVASVAGLLGHRRTRIAAPAAMIALTAQVAAGHAGASSSPVVATGVLVVHLAAAGVWLFAIAAALLARRLRRALGVLSPYAAAAAAAVATTGAAGAALQRVGPGQLVTTGYGRVLLVKAAVLVLVAGLGGWHALQRANPRRTGLRWPLRLEAAAAGLALIVATVLAGSAPPTSASPLSVSTTASSLLGSVDGRRALSIADATGPYVVGLTISPATAGPVTSRVEILSSNAGDVFSDVSIHAIAADSPAVSIPLRAVGTGTFAGAGRVGRNGDWTFGVSFRARGALNHVTLAASLPAPDGAGALAEAFAAEERITSVRLGETLRSQVGSPPIVAHYMFHAPNSFTFTANGSHEIDIGALAYRQDRPGRPWTVENTGAAFGWPSPYFRQAWANATAARIVGTDVIDGVPSHIVAFVRPDLPAWFELWIGDSDGLVRREEMRAEGHLMQHDYTAFNAPTAITPPR